MKRPLPEIDGNAFASVESEKVDTWIPEIDHNAVVIYTGLDDNGVLVYLRFYTPFPYSRQENRMPKGPNRGGLLQEEGR